MKKITLAMLVFAVGVVFSVKANAAVMQSTLDVTATVTTSCTMSINSMAFGEYGGIEITTTSTIYVSCPDGTAYNIALSGGQSYNGERRLASFSGDFLNYSLFKDAAYSEPWGDSDFDSTFPQGTSLAATQQAQVELFQVYGVLGANQNVAADDYFDTLTVSVYY